MTFRPRNPGAAESYSCFRTELLRAHASVGKPAQPRCRPGKLLWAGSCWPRGLCGDLGQALEVAVCFEEEQPTFVFCEVDLYVAVGQLPGMDAIVADVAHEAGERAERVRLPLAVAGQAAAQGVGDRALELRSVVAVGELVHCGHGRAQALAGRVPRAFDGGAEQAGCVQEHATAVGLDRLPQAAFGARVKAQRGEIGDEDV